MPASTCSPVKTSLRQPKSVKSVAFSAWVTSLRPFAKASGPLQCLTAFSHQKPCFCYCWGLQNLYIVLIRTNSVWWLSGKPSPWQQVVSPPPLLRLYHHLAGCLADFIHLSAHSPLMMTAVGPQKIAHNSTPQPVHVHGCFHVFVYVHIHGLFFVNLIMDMDMDTDTDMHGNEQGFGHGHRHEWMEANIVRIIKPNGSEYLFFRFGLFWSEYFVTNRNELKRIFILQIHKL